MTADVEWEIAKLENDLRDIEVGLRSVRLRLEKIKQALSIPP